MRRPAVVDRAVRRVRTRGRTALLRALRLSGAAVAAYLAADAVLPERLPLLAPLTALLVVQVSLVGTLADSLRRILAVVAGVAVAVLFSGLAGFTWWSLGLLVAAGIVLGQLLRLGPHLLEVPISAMLVLSVGASESAAVDRVAETLVGAAVGIVVNLLFPPAVATATAGAAVERCAQRLAEFLDGLAAEVEAGMSREQALSWLLEARRLGRHITRADEALVRAEESRRLNPRAVGRPNPGPQLRHALDTLEHIAVTIRNSCRSLVDELETAAKEDASRYDREVQGVFGALLRDLATALRTHGTLVRVEVEDVGSPPGEALTDALDAVRETRVGLTQLLLVDPRLDSALWVLHRSMLANVEHVLSELEAEERELQRVRQERESLGDRPRAALAMAQLRASTRAVPRPGRRG